MGTPESHSHTRVDVEEDVETTHRSRLGVEDDLKTFGRKMSYALQVDSPLSQGFKSPNAVSKSTFASPTLGSTSRRPSGIDDSESSSRWTPPGRISRPSVSHARSPSQPSPERIHSPRMSSAGSYMTKRQQQAYDLKSEVDEENRKRRERRTVVVKDGYKIVDGVRAKASSSGVYTRESRGRGLCSALTLCVSYHLPTDLERREIASYNERVHSRDVVPIQHTRPSHAERLWCIHGPAKRHQSGLRTRKPQPGLTPRG